MLLICLIVNLLLISHNYKTYILFKNMWSFIKGLLLIKDRPIAKDMVEDDQRQNMRHRGTIKRFDFRKRSSRRKKYAMKKSTNLKLTVYNALIRFIKLRK